MLIQRRPMGVVLSVVLLAGACGDDSKGIDYTQDGSSIVGTPGDGGSALPDDKDGGIHGSDGGNPVDIDAGGAADLDSSLPDGATVPAPVGDGSVQVPSGDGSVQVPSGDGSVQVPSGDGSVQPSGDGSVQAGDAALVVDSGGASEDGGPIPLDAAAPDASLPSDAGPCPINHPMYGCGHAVSASWVVFDNGLEIDRANNRAWTPVVDVVDDDALRAICTPLALGGLTGFNMPQTSDVRTLAAGCAATVPGGACEVNENMAFLAEGANCICPGGVGPNNGKFCRPEVPDCETLWAWTHTFETGEYQHWFYDVTTGSIVPEYVGVGIALTAKGRCMRALTDAELP